jgi:hypothetical protein
LVQASTASGLRVAQTDLVSVAAAPVFGADGNGNMTTDGRFTNSWNDEERLVSAVPVAWANGTRTVEHGQDWTGRRILCTVFKRENETWLTDNWTRCVSQDWHVIWEAITHTPAPREQTGASRIRTFPATCKKRAAWAGLACNPFGRLVDSHSPGMEINFCPHLSSAKAK